MQVVATVQTMRAMVKEWKQHGLSVGLVPTMGYLHKGHASLIRHAVSECDRVVVSIFVNPMQFGPREDLETYPRDMARDKAICKENGAAIVFAPEALEMYPNDFATFVKVERLGGNLCGHSRPIHFRGVCTVVNKLFNIISPDRAYFGRKDAQQCIILGRMVRDMNLDVEIVDCPTVREPDGLAVSSRNVYLSSEERDAAKVLYRAIVVAEEMFQKGERKSAPLITRMREILDSETLVRADYVEVVNPQTLSAIQKIDRPVLVALAIYLGKTRLIDNTTLDPKTDL